MELRGDAGRENDVIVLQGVDVARRKGTAVVQLGHLEEQRMVDLARAKESGCDGVGKTVVVGRKGVGRHHCRLRENLASIDPLRHLRQALALVTLAAQALQPQSAEHGSQWLDVGFWNAEEAGHRLAFVDS